MPSIVVPGVPTVALPGPALPPAMQNTTSLVSATLFIDTFSELYGLFVLEPIYMLMTLQPSFAAFSIPLRMSTVLPTLYADRTL